ncbi:unnamed protein product [Aureobasidium uvarum]|uniref:Uncharacterized protein n=1 Tax=Aureobasidium uvarum TaxID=2773716 RepID=A0A9N8KFC2_9PEZI|nr:unnamed protein product [Aureobasidium uvarum]
MEHEHQQNTFQLRPDSSALFLASQHDMDVPTRITRPLYADGQPVRTGVIEFGMDGCITPMSPTSVMKIPRLDATLLPDGSLEPDGDNIWRRDSLEVEKQVYRRLHGIPGLANWDISING